MIRKGRTARLLILGVSVLCFVAEATVPGEAGNPYANIVVRNVFGLRPPPPPAPPPPDPAKEPSSITLTGIITIGGKRALMKTRTKAKPPEKPKEESYILAEGQRGGDIEVLSIDATAGKVKVNNRGKIETLDFEHNGPKLPSAASLAAAAAPHPAGQARPGLPGQPVMRNTIVGPRQIPQRPVRTTSANPTPGAPSFGTANRAPQYQNVHIMTPEQQVIMIEAQRQKMLEEGDPTAKILPPTELTPPGSPGSGIPLPQ